MMTKMTWDLIRDTLETEISTGILEPGAKLPTEPELAARFRVGRHSVRRAIEALAKEGRLRVEQGRGTFIEATPEITYTIGKRTRLHKNLLPQGIVVKSDLIDGNLIVAPKGVQAALQLPEGAKVVESRRLTCANDLPIAFGSIYHSAERFIDMVERRDCLGSLTETYKSYGIDDYLRGETTMYARPARPDEAKMLKQHPDMPVIVVRAVDTELDGHPLAVSKVIWSSARVKFTMAQNDD